jgi:hypothetical protein
LLIDYGTPHHDHRRGVVFCAAIQAAYTALESFNDPLLRGPAFAAALEERKRTLEEFIWLRSLLAAEYPQPFHGSYKRKRLDRSSMLTTTA